MLYAYLNKPKMDKPDIYIHPEHDHFWVQDGTLYESYMTLTGLRFRVHAKEVKMKDHNHLHPEDLSKKFTIIFPS